MTGAILDEWLANPPQTDVEREQRAMWLEWRLSIVCHRRVSARARLLAGVSMQAVESGSPMTREAMGGALRRIARDLGVKAA